MNWFLCILVDNKLMTTKEAEYLSRELAHTMHPTDFKEAKRVFDKVMKDYTG